MSAPKKEDLWRSRAGTAEAHLGAFVDIVTDLAGREETMEVDEALAYLREWVASRHNAIAWRGGR